MRIQSLQPSISSDPEHPNQLDNPNQWWRFIWALFMSAGVIHFVLCAIVQLYLGCQIERTAGWLRTMIIYFISGIGGYIVSGIFDSQGVGCGADPAIFGLLAVVTVELFQSWQVVPNKWRELLKILFIIIAAFVIGTLPFVDNWSHLGGYIFGLLSAIIFLPYITFGKWDMARKRCLLYVSAPLLAILFVVCLIMFYTMQDTSWCSWCDDFNCVEYSSDMPCN